ncbi:DUF4124 domain-containing protein [Marinobacter sp. X15-166B]|uniref:DUF4124 domain-containing protein n=1 Tax=Marinobacter sp. X15-166B TaxID=1897620 RepID=UPI00085C9E8A|nr:DUF4124 domain-containing protein [Marinobacter sp. X15-166B]OEY66487.1 hypothetical protein BG841_08475 [Marinobacter sp. X15-166B]
MSRLTRTTASALTMTLVLLASTADARIYRYTDEHGQLVIGTSVPQRATARGYEVLNDAGRVVEVIAPAPTAEQLAERERQAQERARAERQLQLDQQLLRRFSHPDDAVRAMNRKLQELGSLIQLKRGNISSLVQQIDEEQRRAANLERSGRAVPDSTMEKINRLQAQIRTIEQEIAIQTVEMDTLKSEFIQDITRLEQITGHERTLTVYTAPAEHPDRQ